MTNYKDLTELPLDLLQYEEVVSSEHPYDFKIQDKYRGQTIEFGDQRKKSEAVWSLSIPQEAAYLNVDEKERASEFTVIFYAEEHKMIGMQEMNHIPASRFRVALSNRLECLIR